MAKESRRAEAVVWHQKLCLSIDMDMRRIYKNGPIIPMKDGPDITKVPKGILKMDGHEAHLFSMHDRANNTINCGLDINEYNRVSACETARERWRLLEVTHEGTNQVKETKINMLIQQYEAFKMKENESINKIHNEEETTSKKKNLALKTEASHEPVESSNDSDPDMTFTTHKFKKFFTNRRDGKIRKVRQPNQNKETMAIGVQEKTPTLAMNAAELDISRSTARSSRINRQAAAVETKEKKFKPRKALLTWDDSDESDKEMNENDDIAQLCFMAKDGHSNEVIPSANFDYDKLELDFLELSENHEKLKLKNAALEKKALSLINTVEELASKKEELDQKIEFYITENASLKNDLIASEKENSDLSSEIQSLKSVKTPVENELLKSQLEKASTQKGQLEKEIENLNLTLSKFTQGRENLDILLGRQMCVFEKTWDWL
ncbi:hypothetical protein RJ640_020411 [Escallonia rubra]|uniref:Uncharacterized protein n=1 Tax=Escallonia rubra TaxID=112253 RepID=A0AA88RLJ9_9ASTE|nr:hypothetical protein RJ640_020411 [Escallonia rubra]